MFPATGENIPIKNTSLPDGKVCRYTYQFNELTEHHVEVDRYWLFFVDDRSHFFTVICKQIVHEAMLWVQVRLA